MKASGFSLARILVLGSTLVGATTSLAILKGPGTVSFSQCGESLIDSNQEAEFCLARVEGDSGAYFTLEKENGVIQLWEAKATHKISQIGKGGTRVQRVELARLGIVCDGQVFVDDAKDENGEIWVTSTSHGEVIQVSGHLNNTALSAENFETIYTIQSGPKL